MLRNERLQLDPSVWADELERDVQALKDRRSAMERAMLGGDPNEQRERCVLGTMLTEPTCKAEAIEMGLVVDCFINQDRRRVFRTVMDMQTPDALTALSLLEGDLPTSCEVYACLAQASVRGSLWQQRVREVVRRYKKLKSRHVAGVIASEDGSIEDIRQTAQAGIVDFLADGETVQTEGADLFAELDDRHAGIEVQQPTIPAHPDLRDVMPSFDFGRFYVLGARPKMGKSLVGLQQAWHAARQGYAVAFISLEMPEREQQARIVSQQTGINSRQLLGRWRPSADDMARIADVRDDMARARFKVYAPTKESPTLDWCRKCVRAAIARFGKVDLVVLDYAQKVAWTDRKLKRDEHVSQVSAWLKELALQGPAVLAMAQVKQLGQGQVWPTRNDLANSDAMLRDADCILLLHRPKADTPPESDPHGERFRGALVMGGSRMGGESVMQVELIPDRSMFVRSTNGGW
jgi:replicative DNA helicase